MSAPPSSDGERASSLGDLAIDARGLEKRFRGTVALAGLDWQVPAGSISGLVGPNGAGKTTAFSLVAGFLRRDAGTLQVLGERPESLGRLGGRVSILPQDATFDANVPILEQLRFLAQLMGLDRATAIRSADQALEAVGLGYARNRAAQALSHGMFKRFGIAQALLGEPALILLDEPTAGLDPENAHQVRQMVRALRGRATLVVSSHNLAEVQDLCDHLAIVQAGRLVAQGATGEIVGEGQILVIQLGAPADGLLDVLTAIDGVTGVTPDESGRRLEIRYDGTRLTPDGLTRTLLESCLARNLPIAGITRGASLEARFLEMTRDD